MKYLDRFGYFKAPIIDHPLNADCNMVVVIPCYNEETLIQSLDSLKDAIIYSSQHVEIIVVVNYSEEASEQVRLQSQKTIVEIQKWSDITQNDILRIHTIEAFDLPHKKAGVGLARKIGMDEASVRLGSIGRSDGVIACFDADCLCDTNYIIEVLNFFKNDRYNACAIAYEHDISDQSINDKAITLYELHLRLYINYQVQIGLPFAIHTVGSSMAVRAGRYQSLGGMNTRKAGEDFYFLHKFIDNNECATLNTTCIYPSSRISDRVPFGTGRAMGEIIQLTEMSYTTYNPKSYELYRLFIDKVADIFENQKLDLSDLDGDTITFLEQQKVDQLITELLANTKSVDSFRLRFFKKFNAFFFMKYLHFMRDQAYVDIDVVWAAKEYLKTNINNPKKLLDLIRKQDRTH